MERISAAQRVHDSPELIGYILKYVMEAKEYSEPEGCFKALPLVSRNCLAHWTKCEYWVTEIERYFSWHRATAAMAAFCDAVTIFEIRDKDRGLKEMIASRSRSKDSSPVSRLLLEEMKIKCPNLQSVRTVIPPVNRERLEPMDDFRAYFSDTDKPSALIIRNIRLEPKDNMRKDWGIKSVAWRGWDVDQAVHLIMSVDAKQKNIAPQRLLAWFKKAARWTIPVIALHTEGFALSLEDLEVIIKQSALTPRGVLQEQQITSVRVTVESTTMIELSKLLKAIGSQLEILDLFPDPSCPPKTGSTPLNLADLPQVVDLMDEYCPMLRHLGLAFATKLSSSSTDWILDSQISHPTVREYGRRITKFRLYTWDYSPRPDASRYWDLHRPTFLQPSDTGQWGDAGSEYSEYATSDFGIQDYHLPPGNMEDDRFSEGHDSARYDDEFSIISDMDRFSIPLLSVARNLINLCTRRPKVKIIHLWAEDDGWGIHTSRRETEDLRKIMKFFRDQSDRTRELVRTLDFDSLELNAAWRITDGKPLPDGTLPGKEGREAMNNWEKTHRYAAKMQRRADRMIVKGKEREEKANVWKKVLQEAGVSPVPIHWPSISVGTA